MPDLPWVSREQLYATGIKAFDERSPDATVDPTHLPVQFAFMPDDITSPGEDDWRDGEWFDQTTARIVIGPGGVTDPEPGAVWWRVTGAIEQPERVIGWLTRSGSKP